MVYAVYNGTITIGQEWTDGSGTLKVHTSHYKCVVQPVQAGKFTARLEDSKSCSGDGTK